MSGLIPLCAAAGRSSGSVGPAAAWTYPAALFASDEDGFWYDPNDLTTLWQDTAGTTPVTAAGQTVARIDDKSGNGHHATQSSSGSRPTYQLDANGRAYLAFSGAKYLTVPSMQWCGATGHAAGAALQTTTISGVHHVLNVTDNTTQYAQVLRLNAANPESITFNTTLSAIADAGPAVVAGRKFRLVESTDASAIEIWTDNASDGSAAFSGSFRAATHAMTVGAWYDGSSGWSGALYGLVYVKRPITSTERGLLDTSLRERYA